MGTREDIEADEEAIRLEDEKDKLCELCEVEEAPDKPTWCVCDSCNRFASRRIEIRDIFKEILRISEETNQDWMSVRIFKKSLQDPLERLRALIEDE